uniref:Uncharacterized protein n=1 Tax=Cucumis melo TaxID=3656 RepID=A0A9I9DJQ7_CUCME
MEIWPLKVGIGGSNHKPTQARRSGDDTHYAIERRKGGIAFIFFPGRVGAEVLSSQR